LGRTKNSKTKEEAHAVAKKHIVDKPLHNPKVAPPVTEYLIHNEKYMVRYRTNGFNGIHVYSVNGNHIGGNKCAFACKHCGAIFRSKGICGHTTFPTNEQGAMIACFYIIKMKT
jgi:hypothetical protein